MVEGKNQGDQQQALMPPPSTLYVKSRKRLQPRISKTLPRPPISGKCLLQTTNASHPRTEFQSSLTNQWQHSPIASFYAAFIAANGPPRLMSGEETTNNVQNVCAVYRELTNYLPKAVSQPPNTRPISKPGVRTVRKSGLGVVR